jgi:CBS domain-containing protein
MIEQIVGDVMTQSVRTIPPETTACDVATLFADQNTGSAIVVDPVTGEYSGIVTESDIMQQVAAGADIESVREYVPEHATRYDCQYRRHPHRRHSDERALNPTTSGH